MRPGFGRSIVPVVGVVTMWVCMVGSATMIGSEIKPLRVVRRALEDGSSWGARPSDPVAVSIYRAVWAWTSGRRGEAVAALEGCASGGPYGALVSALGVFFGGGAGAAGSVYSGGPEAFAAYIRGGGNVELYDRLVARLGALYTDHQSARLLDVGPGDGQVLVRAWPSELGAVDLVEPAAGLLVEATAALEAAGVAHQAHPMGIEAFLDEQPRGRCWPLVQATFSLQSLVSSTRERVLSRLAECCDRLVVAEFDVPTRRDSFDPEWFLRCIDRVESGLHEYGADRELVAQGFLIPMMLGFFDVTAPSNHEQPVAAWTDQLHAAGFELAEPPLLLFDYWWAPAYLLHATPRPVAAGSSRRELHV